MATAKKDGVTVELNGVQLSEKFMELVWSSASETTRRHLADSILMQASRDQELLMKYADTIAESMVKSASAAIVTESESVVRTRMLEKVESESGSLISKAISTLITKDQIIATLMKEVGVTLDRKGVDEKIDELMVEAIVKRTETQPVPELDFEMILQKRADAMLSCATTKATDLVLAEHAQKITTIATAAVLDLKRRLGVLIEAALHNTDAAQVLDAAFDRFIERISFRGDSARNAVKAKINPGYRQRIENFQYPEAES